MANPTTSIKLCLLGESAVGKSSIVTRRVRHQFQDFNEATIGAAFLTQIMNLPDRSIKFEIWDTAGQERYHSLAPMYYRGAHAAIIVYDITSDSSFDRAKTWVNELKTQGDRNTPVIALAGNKSDLSAKRAVLTEDAQAYAAEKDLIFFETSAKTNHNIDELFQEIALKLSQRDIPSNAADGNAVFRQGGAGDAATSTSCCK